jgi:hypothetical protein
MRTFAWWFGMGGLTTLSVLMVQGGVRDLIYDSYSSSSTQGILSVGLTILGGGLLAGCLAVILDRFR